MPVYTPEVGAAKPHIFCPEWNQEWVALVTVERWRGEVYAGLAGPDRCAIVRRDVNCHVMDRGGVILGGTIAHDAAQLLVPGTDGSEWHVFHTRPRREKKAAELFAQMELPHYLPLRENVTRTKGRRFTSQVPLFPGYVFGCCDGGARLRAMRSGCFAQWLEVKDQTRLLTELRGIQLATEHGTDVQLYPQLQRGQWVHIVRGPLRGVRGRISRRKDRFRIVLELTALQAAVAVEVDMQDVEPIEVEPEW